MKSRSTKIGKIVSIAASEERRHGAAAGESRRDLNKHLARLGELNAYRHGYSDTSRHLMSINSAHWQDYQNFLQRLDQALMTQQQIVKDSEQNLEMHRHRWQVKRRRLDTLRNVLERYQHEESIEAERRLQRALDDLPIRGSPYSDA